MATKTITIDVEAYSLLASVRHDGESFSRAIKRVVRPPLDVDAYIKRLEADPMSPEAICAIEAQIANRRRSSNRER